MPAWWYRRRPVFLEWSGDGYDGRLGEAGCALLEAQEEAARPRSDPNLFTKEDVLGCDTAYPKTLHEYALEDHEHWWLDVNTETHDTFSDFFSNIRNFAFLGQIRHGVELHSKLPPSDTKFENGAVENLHDVWLICKPYGSRVEAFRHWSVLTQGRIAHLTADKGGHATSFASQTNSKKDFLDHLFPKKGKGMADLALKWQDLSSSGNKNYQELRSRPNTVQFVAYNVGRTIYTPLQVSKLAEAIIKCMNRKRSYHLFDNNCQHFAISLIRYTVMTQSRHIALGGTLLDIVDYTEGRPGYEVKEWLTTAKRKLLFLPETISNPKVKSQRTASTEYMDKSTLAHWIEAAFFKKTWLEVPLKVLESEHPMAEGKVQYHKHAKERVHNMSRLVQKSSVFLHMVMWSRTWLVKSSWVSATVPWVKYAIPAIGVVSSALVTPALLGVAFYLYLFVVRTVYARGSSKPVHYVINRTGPLPTSPPTSSDEDSDYDGIPQHDDPSGRGDDELLLMDYTPEVLEAGLLHAEQVFSPNWFARSQSTEVPSFDLSAAYAEQSIPRGAMTPDHRDRKAVPNLVRSFSSSAVLPMYDPSVKRTASPATPPDSPHTSGSIHHVRSLRPDTVRSYSYGPSMGRVNVPRHALSPLRPSSERGMSFSEPFDLHLGQLSFQDQSPIAPWNGQRSQFLHPAHAYSLRSSLQLRVPSPLRNWDENSPGAPSSSPSGPQPLLRRAISQPPKPNSLAIALREAEGLGPEETLEAVRPVALRQFSEPPQGARPEGPRRWTSSSPRPHRRQRSTDLSNIDWETDEAPSSPHSPGILSPSLGRNLSFSSQK